VAKQPATWQNGYDYSYMTSNLPAMHENNIFIIFGVIIVYAVVVGPVMYLALKKRDARERGFLVIPAVSAVVTLAIFIISSDTVYKKPIINVISHVTLEGGNGTARMFAGALTPWKGDVKITFDGNIQPYFGQQSYYNYQSYTTSSRKRPELQELVMGEAPELIYYDTSVWQSDSFQVDAEVDAGDGFKCDFYIGDGFFNGQIVNETGKEFRDIIVFMQNTAVMLEDVKIGETAEFSVEMEKMELYPDFYTAFNKIYGDNIARMAMSSEQQRSINLMQNMASTAYNNSYQSGFNQSVVIRSSASLYPIASETLPPPTDDGYTELEQQVLSAVIFAFSDEKASDFSLLVNNRPATELYTTMYTESAPVDIYRTREFDIPGGIIGPVAIECNVPYEVYPQSFFTQQSGDAALTFALPAGAEIEHITFTWNVVADKEIYNAASGEWEPYNATESALITNAGDYVENDTVKIRLLNYMGSADYPMMGVKGRFPDAGDN
jgi:hypothetical protein